MASADDHDARPVTDEIHDNSWSVNLETDAYADAPDRAVRDGISAIKHTTTGNHVNLVTHGELGHPSSFLYDALAEYDGRSIDWEYIDQCGCGGHVTRVHVE
ncbi:CGCGG family putative rSAM-modified RiPP protein [Halovenus halobia]|uniref:CGCGG family putative rSAM-modified RiPP protein n=1 Tax=Halovenus halobia TaxID=3396622 RepID=UPI003F56DD18